jgi:drug/metabolite transporter (DMT)-like permease
MKSKWTLFAGIILLTLGIILRRVADLGFGPILLIITGVLFKTYYIVSKARSGEYKPGYELIFLLVGLIMFLSGLYLRSHEPPFNPAFLIAPGIMLKVVFIILFIVKIRGRKNSFRK